MDKSISIAYLALTTVLKDSLQWFENGLLWFRLFVQFFLTEISIKMCQPFQNITYFFVIIDILKWPGEKCLINYFFNQNYAKKKNNGVKQRDLSSSLFLQNPCSIFYLQAIKQEFVEKWIIWNEQTEQEIYL